MKKVFKGTPGPWKIMSDSPDGSEIESEHESPFWAFVSYDTPEAERTPNAQLIAAAPELLEAVEGLLVCMGLAGWEDDAMAVRARAALAKALGEKP